MSDKTAELDPDALAMVKARFADLRSKEPKKPRAPRKRSVLEARRQREDRAINYGDLRRRGRPNSLIQINIKTRPESKERFGDQIARRSKQRGVRVYAWEHLEEMLDLMDERIAQEAEKQIS